MIATGGMSFFFGIGEIKSDDVHWILKTKERLVGFFFENSAGANPKKKDTSASLSHGRRPFAIPRTACACATFKIIIGSVLGRFRSAAVRPGPLANRSTALSSAVS